MIDEQIDEHLAEEHHRREGGQLDEQQDAEAAVGTPKRDPGPVELVPDGEFVDREIDREKRESEGPEPRAGQMRAAGDGVRGAREPRQGHRVDLVGGAKAGPGPPRRGAERRRVETALTATRRGRRAACGIGRRTSPDPAV